VILLFGPYLEKVFHRHAFASVYPVDTARNA